MGVDSPVSDAVLLPARIIVSKEKDRNVSGSRWKDRLKGLDSFKARSARDSEVSYPNPLAGKLHPNHPLKN
jgi:hypothetical protein